jgi:transposase
MDTPATVCRQIIAKSNEGMSQRAIASQLKVSQSAVARTILRYRKTGKCEALREGRCGRKHVLSIRTERLLAHESLRNPRATA